MMILVFHLILLSNIIPSTTFTPKSLLLNQRQIPAFTSKTTTLFSDTKLNGETSNVKHNDKTPNNHPISELLPTTPTPPPLISEEFVLLEEITLPRHSTNPTANNTLVKTEQVLKSIHQSFLHEQELEDKSSNSNDEGGGRGGPDGETIFANSYVDLGRVDTVGFDFDYTLVTYTEELLKVIYDMALKRLVDQKHYPRELLEEKAHKMKFDPQFSIRGLAVDKENGWICHLTYTHHVSVAWYGREQVSRQRLMAEYTGKRSLRPSERKKRLKPLNDLFSMSECCLIANVVQFFKDKQIPLCPRSVVTDVLQAIGTTHMSGDFHRLVAKYPEKYFHKPEPYLNEVIQDLKASGKRLVFVSNSPFWYVDAGMNFFFGEGWRENWDVVIVSAGKPLFYTEDNRPFREVSTTTGRIKFKKIDRLEPGEVYTEGCLHELTKCLDWSPSPSRRQETANGSFLASPNVLYIGDSLFADLVDAKREFGWTTAAVTPEINYEIEIQNQAKYVLAQQTIDLILDCLRIVQTKYDSKLRSEEDDRVLNELEGLVSKWRSIQTNLHGNPFGSVFRAKYQPSLFAHSLRRYCDLYMSSVGSLRHYSPQHRFYPEDVRLLSHEIRGTRKGRYNGAECWTLEELAEMLDETE